MAATPGAHCHYSEQPILSLPTLPAPFLPMETTGSFCLDFPSLPRPPARPWGYPVAPPGLAWHFPHLRCPEYNKLSLK